MIAISLLLLHCNGQFCDIGIGIELAHHLDSNDGYFSSLMITTGNENENNNSLNTYSQIGVVTNNDPTIYKDSNNYYTFKLKYITIETNYTQTLIWSQTSWLTEQTTIGYTPINVPNRTNNWRIPFANFNGLALSNSNQAYLSSVHSILPNAWFNSVGTTGCNNCVSKFTPSPGAQYTGGEAQPDGIIGYDSLTCWFMQLHICQPPITSAPTTTHPTTPIPSTQNPTTSTPTTINPTTVIPTTSQPSTMDPTTQQLITVTQTTTKHTTANPTTYAPILDNNGEINDESTTEIYIDESDDKNDSVRNSNALENNDIIPYIIVIIGVFICLVLLGCVIYICRKNKNTTIKKAKEIVEAQSPISVSTVSNSNKTNNVFFKSENDTSTQQNRFNNNLTNLAGVHNVLMDDVINHMNETEHVTIGGPTSFDQDDEIELQDIKHIMVNTTNVSNGEQDLEVQYINKDVYIKNNEIDAQSDYSVDGITSDGGRMNDNQNMEMNECLNGTTAGKNVQEHNLNPNLQNDEFIIQCDEGDNDTIGNSQNTNATIQ